MIADLHLSHYVLHGESYGTVVATITAGLAEQAHTARPDFIVLEGTLGRDFRTPTEEVEPTIRAWSHLMQTLPSDIVLEFKKVSPPLGLTGGQWGNWIETQLFFRYHGILPLRRQASQIHHSERLAPYCRMQTQNRRRR